jgi:deoxycytidine triphosphate deaminase
VILTGAEIEDLIHTYKMIQKYKDLGLQVQPAGFDVTLKSVDTVIGHGAIANPNHKALPPRYSIQPNEDDVFQLSGNTTYIMQCNEIFKIPVSISAFAYARSTLMRMGVLFTSAMIDAGYEGPLEFAIKTTVPIQLEKDCRFSQIIFHRHEPTRAYDGSYQNKVIKNAIGTGPGETLEPVFA